MVFLKLVLIDLADGAAKETEGENFVEINALDVADAVSVAKHEQPGGAVFDRAGQTGRVNRLQVKVRLAQQVKQPIRLRVNHLEMLVDHSEEEAPAEGRFVREAVSRVRSRDNDLDFDKRECRLIKRRFVLTQDDLSLVRVRLVAIVVCVGDDCVVFLAWRNVSLVLEAWTRSDNNIAHFAGPAHINSVHAHVLLEGGNQLESVLFRHSAQDESLLCGQDHFSSLGALAHAVDVAGLADPQRVRHLRPLLSEHYHV